MKGFLKTLGNATVVIGGFFIVFFSVSKHTHSNNGVGLPQWLGVNDQWGVANADAPSCSSSDSSSSSSGGGDSGGSDSGGSK